MVIHGNLRTPLELCSNLKQFQSMDHKCPGLGKERPAVPQMYDELEQDFVKRALSTGRLVKTPEPQAPPEESDEMPEENVHGE